MDTVTQLRAFLATAQSGSFTGAADALGLSNRLTSKYVAELERRLGVRLFQRTTRKVGLTPAGEALLARVPAVLDELDDLLSEVAEGSCRLTGVLRLSAPVTFGEAYVAPMLARFCGEHPELTVDLRLSDRFTDLAGEGMDLAFRLGASDTLSLKERKLGEFASILVASPDYLAKNTAPGRPEDLSQHDCILDTNRRAPRRWLFAKDGQDIPVQVTGRFQVNSARAAACLAVQGRGIAYVPRFALDDELEAGVLVPVLGDYAAERGPVNIVYLEGQSLPRKLRALIEFAAEDFRSSFPD